MGVNGSRWMEATYPFSRPDEGIAGPDSIAYPLDLECGTTRQHAAEVEAWIYDAAGQTSQPVVIRLACRPDPETGTTARPGPPVIPLSAGQVTLSGRQPR
jgi:hypothetical protein